jgi:hypothetical protein
MSITITDPALLAQFAAAAGVVQLTDPSGGVIGTLHKEPFGAPPPGYVPPISDEEIARRRQQHRSGKPLSEIMKRLGGGPARVIPSNGRRPPKTS